jgi:hypothetical protein
MDPLLLLSESVGFFTRPQAMDCGVSDREIAALVRRGAWRRFRRGYYCHAIVWDRLDHVAQHRVRCRAVIDSMGPDVVALSHGSGALAHHLDVWNVDLRRVHVTRLDGGAGRTEGDVVHHEGLVGRDEVQMIDDMPVLPAVRCALETASRTGSEEALCLLDSGLHRAAYDPDQLMAQFKVMYHWPHTRHLHIPVRMADGASASVGESRCRWFFWRHGIPAPLLQFPVHDGDELIGIVDWAWPARKALGEFDGRIKYGRLLEAGMEPGDVVFAEKRREDRIRAVTGFVMVRMVWDDLQRPRVLADHLRSVLGVMAG